MRTVNHFSKRILALLLVCVLCINLCFSTGLLQPVTAEKVAAGELDLMDSASFSGKTGVLSYDVNKKEGWIGGDGTTASTDMPARYFSYDTFGSVVVGGEAVPLTSREVTYSVTFSDLAYDTAKYPSGVRQQGVILMLQYNDGSKNWTLENRFGGIMYGSGHYMQVGGTGSTLLASNAGAPFYSESVKNSVAKFPALADGDTISLKVKCADGTENGYIKLLLNGEEKHSFVYTGTKLPEFGLKACKLMAKISNISLKVDGATGWNTCTGHVESEQIVDVQPTDQQEGRWHTECTLCGEIINTGTIPVLAGMELINADASLVNQKVGVLTYDVNAKEGWIGGDGTTASTTQQACYFQYTAYENVMVGGKAVPLTDCEVTYSVTFSDFAYDTATYPSGVRQQGVVLMLQYNDGVKTWKLENRFGAQMYASGHYMQIGGTNSTLLADNAGAPFYSESRKNSVAYFPALANGDTISLKVKCAKGTENGYIKLLLNGEEKHSFIYTGTTLPNFGLKACKLMAKVSNVSLKVESATGWASSNCENPVWEKEITKPTCGEPGYTTYTCTTCGESYKADKVAPLGHTCKDGICTVCGAKEWDTDGDGVLEILALGNSFSIDALEYVWNIADNLGIKKIVLGNLYIGGCSLQTHASNAAGDLANYTYYYNDSGKWTTAEGYKISTTLEGRSWDYVSLQQQSGHSGLPNTYNDNLTYLIDYIRERSYAKLVWHMTWAYQQDSTNGSFANYNKDQMTMYNAIVSTVQSKISTNSNFALIVPNGTAVQNSRTTPLGDTTTRDGYHMSTDYGRYLTGLMFFKQITGMSIDGITYAPAGVDGVEKSYAIESVNNAYAKPFAVTQSTLKHTAGKAVKENVTAATCSTPAFYESVVYCTDCSVELSRETIVTAPAPGHNFVNGICSVCGIDEVSTKKLNLMDDASFDGKAGILFYDVIKQEGWIGGNGTTASTDQLERYFQYATFKNVMVDGKAVALTSREVTYSVTFSDFAYDTATYPNGVRQQGVTLMLQYNDGTKTWKLENRFGGLKYGSGHYMQVNGNNSTLLADNAGAPFYSETVKNSVTYFPALVDGDTITLKVKCANGSENGYIKLLLNGEVKHTFIYTGTKLPSFGLKSCKLMAKISDISLMVEGANCWAAACENHVWEKKTTAPTCGEPGYTTYTCTKCSESYTDNKIPPLGHTCKNGICTVCGAKEWDTDGDGVLEILALGNSFSVDALEYVWQIADNLGIEKIVLGNLNIGGCSLQTHAANAAGDLGNYNYRYNDNGNWSSSNNYKISTALESRTWDYVSLQQVSGNSGMANTYDESLTNLVAYIKERSDAKLIWHMTWAYQQNTTNESFANYGKDQMKMYNAIVSTVKSKIIPNSDFALIIPNGTAVQNSRTSILGDTTTRDGFHMSTGYGRYLTGLMFFKKITGMSIDGITYAPAGVSALEKSFAIESVNNAYAKPFEVTQSSVQHKAGTAVKENVTAATCTTPSCYDLVVYCTKCGVEMSRKTVVVSPALGHKYVDGVCTVCGKNEGVDLITSATFDSKDGVLFYDVNRGQGWIGGDGTTLSTEAIARYFSFDTYGNVVVNGEAVPLTSREVTYSVTFSGFDYDTDTYPSGVRQEGVILMLRYNDGSKTWTLENRFGDMKYQSGHYMQVGGSASTLLDANPGAPFYSESVKNSVAHFPVLADGDTISLKVKCANGSENGYIKLLLNGEEKHTLIYTGTKLPEFGLKSFRLMAKMTNISLTVAGATGWSECTSHVESERIVDAQPSTKVEGKWHTECTVCGEVINTGTIPVLIGLELIDANTSLTNQKVGVLSYDVNKQKGWIGGNGITASTEMLERYFSCNTLGNVLVGGKSVPLTSREVTYSVTFSDFKYDAATYPSGVRQQGVILMLRYNDWILENRFGDTMYDSGHYMQIGSGGSTLLDANPGSPFYSEGVKNSVADFPALADGDTISLKVKCATKTENGYIKLLLNGKEMHSFVYTGTKLPEFGLKSFKLMAKMTNIAVTVDGATGRSECKNHSEGKRIVDVQPGVGTEGKWHTACTLCGKTIKTGTIPALAGMDLIDSNASLISQNKDVLIYDIAKKEGWIGGNGATSSMSSVDGYFTFPTYKDVLVDGKAVNFTDCELLYSMVFSDFNYEAGKNCRNSAVCLMLRYTDGDKVYKLENRFGGIIYDSGHYMQTYVNGIGLGNALQDTGAPFYSTVKNSFMNVPALENGDRVELRIKCANDTQNGYIKLFLNGVEIGEFVYTGTTFPEVGLESMKLMAKVSNISLMVNGATQWAECNCAVPNVKRYETAIQSTCTTDGLKFGKCVDCDNLHSVAIPAAHVEGKDWIVDQEADCTQAGRRHIECMICFEYTQEEVIPARGHRSYWVEDKAATKLTAGSKHEECMICKAVLDTQEIPPEWNPVLVIGGGVVLIAGLAVGIFFLVKSRRKK